MVWKEQQNMDFVQVMELYKFRPGESVWQRPLRVCCSLSVLRRPLESALQRRIIPSVSPCSSRLLRQTSASNFPAGGGENEIQQRGGGDDRGSVTPPALLSVPRGSTDTPEGKLMCPLGAWTASHDGTFTNPSEVSTRRPGLPFSWGAVRSISRSSSQKQLLFPHGDWRTRSCSALCRGPCGHKMWQ